MKRGNSAGSAGDKSLPITVDFAPTQGQFLPVVYSRLYICTYCTTVAGPTWLNVMLRVTSFCRRIQYTCMYVCSIHLSLFTCTTKRSILRVAL